MRRRKLYILFFIFLSLPFESSAESLIVGVSTHFSNYDPKLALPALREAGVKSFRDELMWSHIEKTKGVYSIPSEYLNLDKILLSGEFNPVLTLGYGNGLYGPGVMINDEQRNAFSNYARWIVRRYKGKVRYYEVWNEWNLKKGYSAKNYVELLKVAYKAIKEIDPNAIVIGGGSAGEGSKFLPEIVRGTGGQYFDALSMHPYNFDTKKSTPQDMISSLDHVENVISKMMGRQVPLYVTEIGWPNFSGHGGIAWDTAGQYVEETFSLASKKSYIKGIWWYDFLDDGVESSQREHGFGIMTKDGRKKPAFFSIKRASADLSN